MNKLNNINNKGFTLIEVLAVIAIIAIIGLIAVPNVINTINSSKEASYYVLIENITTGSKQLFEELDFTNVSLYHYDNNGKTEELITIKDCLKETCNETPAILTTNLTNDKIIPTNMAEYNPESIKAIVVNLQTLVSNGFLKGSNNHNKTGNNKNSKIVINPKTKEDIGDCEIIIGKIVNSSVSDEENKETRYMIASNSTDLKCPTTDEYSFVLNN